MNDTINYNITSVENAMRCLKEIKELESDENFGKLSYSKPNNFPGNKRYTIDKYNDSIDSKYYTDKSIATLAFTISNLEKTGEVFSDDITSYINDLNTDAAYQDFDLINDSSEEFADFQGDESILALEGLDNVLKLNLYYSGIDKVTDNDIITNENFFKVTLNTGDEYYIHIPKNLNKDTEINFHTYGSGGANEDYQKAIEKVLDSDQIFIFPVSKNVIEENGKNGYLGGDGQSWEELMVQILDDFNEKTGISLNNVKFSSHSLGANSCLRAAAKYIEVYNPSASLTILLLDGCNNEEPTSVDERTREILKTNGALIFGYCSEEYYTRMNFFAKTYGLNTTIITDLSIKKGDMHQLIHEKLAEIISFVSGSTPLIDTADGYHIKSYEANKIKYDNIGERTNDGQFYKDYKDANTLEKIQKIYDIEKI